MWVLGNFGLNDKITRNCLASMLNCIVTNGNKKLPHDSTVKRAIQARALKASQYMYIVHVGQKGCTKLQQTKLLT